MNKEIDYKTAYSYLVQLMEAQMEALLEIAEKDELLAKHERDGTTERWLLGRASASKIIVENMRDRLSTVNFLYIK